MSNNHGDIVIEDTTINAGGAKGYGYGPFAFDVCGYSDYNGVSVTVKGNSVINGNIEISRSSNKSPVGLTLESGTVTGELKIDDSIKLGENTTITKSDSFKVAAPAGYKWDEGTLKKITYVAEAGGVKYESLQKAIDAAKSKAVVTMLADTRENVTISTPYNGLMLHASAAALGGRAYLFSGPCGRGKSTHTRLWQQTFGEAVQVFNDDKPALRRLDGRWYAYGTPWCGKDGINLNQKWPLGGICFLEKSQENRIRRLPAAEALPLILAQTTYRLQPHSMELLLASLDSLLREIPVFLLENRPEEAAARLSFETMRRAAKEEGL